MNSGEGLPITSTTDLEQLAKKLKIPNFSVVSKQNLPTTPIKNKTVNMIINIDNGATGTHWVCVHNSKKQKYCIYFDSFGVAIDPAILSYMKTSSFTPIQLQIHAQSIDESSCGWWCIYFLHLMSKGMKPSAFLGSLSSDQDKNEDLLTEWFNKTL